MAMRMDRLWNPTRPMPLRNIKKVAKRTKLISCRIFQRRHCILGNIDGTIRFTQTVAVENVPISTFLDIDTYIMHLSSRVR